jgi:hypothetical protein
LDPIDEVEQSSNDRPAEKRPLESIQEDESSRNEFEKRSKNSELSSGNGSAYDFAILINDDEFSLNNNGNSDRNEEIGRSALTLTSSVFNDKLDNDGSDDDDDDCFGNFDDAILNR